MMRYIQKYAPNEPLPTNESTLFSDLDVNQTANTIIRSGYSPGLDVPEEYVDGIVEYCKEKGLVRYLDPHKECEFVSNIVYDPKLVEIARKYLGVEPVLYGTSIYWSPPKHNSDDSQPLHAKKRDFHYDVADFKSLTLFVYLTDVDIDCGPHIVIEQTRQKTLKQLLVPFMSYDEAIKRYGSCVKTITGRRGTIFFEDQTSYHQHSISKKQRLVLTISYVFHRRPE